MDYLNCHVNQEPVLPRQQLHADILRLPGPSAYGDGERLPVQVPSSRVQDTRVSPTGRVPIVEFDEIVLTRTTLRVAGSDVPTWTYEGNVHFDESQAEIANMMRGASREAWLCEELGAAEVEIVSRTGDTVQVRAHFVVR